MKKCEATLPSKLDRKTVERNRRTYMKNLCFELASLIPPNHFNTSKNIISQKDQLDQAASYIKQLRERKEKLKKKKEEAMKSRDSNVRNNCMNNQNGLKLLPLVELREQGSIIEVLLVTGLQKNFMLYEVISVIEEEGAEVISANFSTVGDKIFHSIHAQVKIPRIGVETSRVCQRLKDLVY